MRHLRNLWAGLRSERGTAAVEFALSLPIIIALYFGGYEITQALSTYRKLTEMTTQLSNIISQTPQNTSLTQSQVMSYITDASLIMAPYSTTSLSMTVTEVQTTGPTSPTPCSTAPCPATIVWQVKSNGATDTLQGTTYTGLPSSLAQPGMGYTLIQANYPFQSPIHYLFPQAVIPMVSQLYMAPRLETIIACSNC
jgi:Flp pilus assembly protein TadG